MGNLVIRSNIVHLLVLQLLFVLTMKFQLTVATGELVKSEIYSGMNCHNSIQCDFNNTLMECVIHQSREGTCNCLPIQITSQKISYPFYFKTYQKCFVLIHDPCLLQQQRSNNNNIPICEPGSICIRFKNSMHGICMEQSDEDLLTTTMDNAADAADNQPNESSSSNDKLNVIYYYNFKIILFLYTIVFSCLYPVSI